MFLLFPVAMAESIAAAFPPPEGFVSVATDAWGEYVRALPLHPAGHAVHTFDGAEIAMPAVRVVDIPVGKRDLQQCADSALRLRATWLRSVGRTPAFHYTSGWLSRWDRWAGGDRPVVKGNRVSTRRGARIDKSDVAFEAWLMDLFTYAGTHSLLRDTDAVSTPRPGDLVMYAGSPGHAVVLLDVATMGERTVVLVGQGYMPAMEFHVVRGPSTAWHEVSGDWLLVEPLPVPWTGLRRFKEG